MGNPAEWFSYLPPQLSIFLLSMLPITELQVSIPVGIEVYKLAIWQVVLFTTLGNSLIAAMILVIMPYAHDWAVNSKIFGNVVTTILKRAEKKFSGNYAKYGSIALVLFVGIPFPLSGVYTGSLAAFVFDIPFRKAFPLLFVGILMTEVIVVLLTLFAGETVRQVLL